MQKPVTRCLFWTDFLDFASDENIQTAGTKHVILRTYHECNFTGSPYQTVVYKALTPVISTIHAILTINGIPAVEGAPVTASRFILTMNSQQVSTAHAKLGLLPGRLFYAHMIHDAIPTPLDLGVQHTVLHRQVASVSCTTPYLT